MTSVLWEPSSGPLRWIVVIGLCLVAAVYDACSHRIPNWLTGLSALGGLTYAAWVGSWAGLGDGLLGMVIMAGPFLVLFLLGGGAGDAKLMGAIGLWLGWRHGLAALLSVLILGAVLGVAWSVLRQRMSSVLANLGILTVGLIGLARRQHALVDARGVLPSQEQLTPMPYGVSIFLGVTAAGLMAWLGHAGVAR